MPDLIAFVESVPLPVYALMAAVGLLLVLWSVERDWRETRAAGLRWQDRPGDHPTDAGTALILDRSYSGPPTDATSYARQRERDQR